MKIFRFLAWIWMVTLAASLVAAGLQKTVEPVNWRELVPFLTDIPGWVAEGEPEGSSVSMGGFKISQAERSYSKKDISFSIEVIDGGFVPMVYAGFKMAMGFEIDTSEEYVKKVTIKGFPGVEKYVYEDKRAEVMILISDRFLVLLDGENFKDTSELIDIAKSLDLEGISKLGR